MAPLNRTYEIWIGGQASGKTYNLRKRAIYLSRLRSIQGVFICDRLNEYQPKDMPGARRYRAFADYLMDDELPRIAIFQLDANALEYIPVFREAINQGDIALVLDEAYSFAPSGGGRFSGCEELQSIVYSGRHLLNVENELRPTHLLVGVQYPKTIYHGIWQQSRTILASKLAGKANKNWVVDNFGDNDWITNQRLQQYQFKALRGNLPKTNI